METMLLMLHLVRWPYVTPGRAQVAQSPPPLRASIARRVLRGICLAPESMAHVRPYEGGSEAGYEVPSGTLRSGF